MEHIFVPIRDVYNITLEKAGYAITYYDTENETGFVVHDSSETRDIEVEAGSVTVSGTVTTSLADADSHLMVQALRFIQVPMSIER